MTPATVETGNAVVTLDLLSAFGTLARGVSLDPMMQHLLRCPRRLDVGGDAGRRSALHASLVDGELAQGATEALPTHAGQHS